MRLTTIDEQIAVSTDPEWLRRQLGVSVEPPKATAVTEVIECSSGWSIGLSFAMAVLGVLFAATSQIDGWQGDVLLFVSGGNFVFALTKWRDRSIVAACRDIGKRRLG